MGDGVLTDLSLSRTTPQPSAHCVKRETQSETHRSGWRYKQRKHIEFSVKSKQSGGEDQSL